MYVLMLIFFFTENNDQKHGIPGGAYKIYNPTLIEMEPQFWEFKKNNQFSWQQWFQREPKTIPILPF